MNRPLALGVDGIVTDEAELLKRVFEARSTPHVTPDSIRGPACRGPCGLRRPCWVPDRVRDDNWRAGTTMRTLGRGYEPQLRTAGMRPGISGPGERPQHSGSRRRAGLRYGYVARRRQAPDGRCGGPLALHVFRHPMIGALHLPRDPRSVERGGEVLVGRPDREPAPQYPLWNPGGYRSDRPFYYKKIIKL